MISTKDFEHKTVSLDGLDIRKHSGCIDKLKSKGWVVAGTSPDTKNMCFNYTLKRRPKKQLDEV
ncbi:MAG: RNA methyltransferase [Desulfobacterales bacterium]|nr:RNA methyltransferase [Desulfobacterales bacterium]MCP4163827.1 RNA methyltransferase [Deltaproteobacteria bacterium]